MNVVWCSGCGAETRIPDRYVPIFIRYHATCGAMIGTADLATYRALLAEVERQALEAVT